MKFYTPDTNDKNDIVITSWITKHKRYKHIQNISILSIFSVLILFTKCINNHSVNILTEIIYFNITTWIWYI
jgi:hypothetical protein